MVPSDAFRSTTRGAGGCCDCCWLAAAARFASRPKAVTTNMSDANGKKIRVFLTSVTLLNLFGGVPRGSADLFPRRGCALTRGKFILDHLAVLHHKSNSLDLGDVGDWISANGDEVGKFPGLDRADAVLPAQHFCRIDGDGTDEVESWHSGLTQVNKSCGTRLPAGFSRIEPAPVGTGGKLHPRLQHALDQLIVFLLATLSRLGPFSVDGRRYHDHRLGDLQISAPIERRRQIEEDSLLAHLLELFFGGFIAVFNGVGTGVNRRLYATGVNGMNGNLEVLTMRFFHYRRKFGHGEIHIGCDLDYVNVLKLVLPDRLPRPVYAVNEQEFLLQDRVGKSGIQIFEV